MRTLRSLIVLVLAVFTYGTSGATETDTVDSARGCFIDVGSCPDPEDYDYWHSRCQIYCGVYSYPGACGDVNGNPNSPDWVLWCYEPSLAATSSAIN